MATAAIAKKWYSISELVKTGESRADLRRAVNHYLAYRYTRKTAGGGKYLINPEEFEKVRYIVLPESEVPERRPNWWEV